MEISKDRGIALAKLSIEQALTKAKSHTKKGEVAEAQVLYGSILKSFPNNKKAQRGLSTLGGGQQSAVERVPPRAIIDQLTNLYNQGKLEVVVEQAQKLTAQYTESAALWNLTGASAIQIGQLDLAIVAFQQVLAIKPNTPEAYSNMGVALKDQGKLDEAIESCNKAISIKPDNPDAYNNIGLALTEQGKVEEAMAAYNKALAIQPDYAKAYNNMGNALKRQGKLDEAIKAYSNALAIKPDYAEAYFNIGFVFEEQGKLEEAIAAYNKALATKPDYAEAYSNMGNALADQGKLEEAIAAYNNALSIKPDYAEAYSNMGVALADQGKLEEAIAAYNKGLAIKPDYALAARNLLKLPIGNIDEKTILRLNKNISILSFNIQDQSQRLFFEANLFTHKGGYEEAFKRFVEANHIKSNEIAPVVENLRQNYDTIVNRIQHWSPRSLKQTEPSLKKLFLLGPSRSGKSSLEKLLMRIPKIYPMYENISLNTLQESEVGSREVKSFDMAELFYHDEHRLLDDRYSFVTSTSPESMFHIDRLLDGLVNSFCVLVKRDRADVASEIFTQEYRNGNFFSYNHSSIQDYLNTYSVIWKEIKRKAPQRTLEIEYEDILVKPKEVLDQINDFTGEHLVLDNAEQYSNKKRISPFREHYAQKFRS